MIDSNCNVNKQLTLLLDVKQTHLMQHVNSFLGYGVFLVSCAAALQQVLNEVTKLASGKCALQHHTR